MRLLLRVTHIFCIHFYFYLLDYDSGKQTAVIAVTNMHQMTLN